MSSTHTLILQDLYSACSPHYQIQSHPVLRHLSCPTMESPQYPTYCTTIKTAVSIQVNVNLSNTVWLTQYLLTAQDNHEANCKVQHSYDSKPMMDRILTQYIGHHGTDQISHQSAQDNWKKAPCLLQFTEYFLVLLFSVVKGMCHINRS